MKTIVKLVLGTAVLAAGASTANAQIPLPSTGSSDLLFFVTDTTLQTTYTEVLSQTVGTGSTLFNSADAKNNASNAVIGTSVATINGKSNFSYNAAANTNLQSFISTAQGKNDSLQWGIYAGVYPPGLLANRKPIGATLAITTAPNATSIVSAPTATLYNAAVPGTGLQSDIKTINGNGPLDQFGGTSNGVIGTPTSTGAANLNFYTMGFVSGINMNSTAQLYGVSTTGNSAGAVLGYDLGSISFNGSTLAFTGNTGVTPPVPLPAAAWLFGSGLLGLLGIGRRRNLAAA
jgi:hypothetical protein